MLHHPVLVNPRWRRRATVTAHIDRRRAVARISERLKLMPPRVPRFRKAVDHQNERTRARLDEVDANTVGHYDAVLEFSHLCRLLGEVADSISGQRTFDRFNTRSVHARICLCLEPAVARCTAQ